MTEQVEVKTNESITPECEVELKKKKERVSVKDKVINDSRGKVEVFGTMTRINY